MTKVVGVRFRQVGKIYFFAPGKYSVEVGQHVIVETARGVEYGSVVLGEREVEDSDVVQPLKAIIRIATLEDDEREAKNREKEKEAYIREHRLTVWRDHDHMHTHQPDSIFAGVIKYLGWESYFNTEISGMMPFFYVFDIPECTVSELGEELKEKIGMNGVRIVGNPEDKMKRVAIVAHLYPNSAMVDEIKEDGYYHSYDMEIMKYMETENIDAIIPGEIIEWTILSYIRDAAYMGKHKACFNIGHFNMEELGMKYAADWIGELLNNEIPVNYIPTEDGWTFL